MSDNVTKPQRNFLTGDSHLWHCPFDVRKGKRLSASRGRWAPPAICFGEARLAESPPCGQDPASRSKLKAQAELKFARRARARHLAESRIDLVALGIEAGCGVHAVPLGMVQQVIKLGAKL